MRTNYDILKKNIIFFSKEQEAFLANILILRLWFIFWIGDQIQKFKFNKKNVSKLVNILIDWEL